MLKKLLGNLNRLENYIPFVIITFSVAILTVIVLMMAMMRPIADDYGYFADPYIGNPFKFAVHYYLDWTGRVGQAFWTSTLYNIFGSSTVTWGSILQLFMFIGSTITLSWALLRNRLKSRPVVWVVAVGLLVSVSTLLLAPSLFDTALWLTSSTVYIGSLIAMSLSAAIALFFAKIKKVKHWQLGILFVITFFAQTFNELTSVYMICGAALLLALHFLKQVKVHLPVTLTYLAASASGFLFMYFAPGTKIRQGILNVDKDLPSVLSGSFANLSRMEYLFTSFRVLIPIILALVAYLILKQISVHKNKQWIGPLLLVASIVFVFGFYLSMRLSIGDSVPFRAYTVPTIVASIAIAIGIGYLLHKNKFINKKQYTYIAPTVLTIAIVLTGIYAIKSIIPTVTAVAMRTNIYDARDASIRQQIYEKDPAVYFEPLPILLTATEAVDFYYIDQPPSWFEDAFRKYYVIPPTTPILYEKQPDAYCVVEGTPGWLGAKDCYATQKEQSPR